MKLFKFYREQYEYVIYLFGIKIKLKNNNWKLLDIGKTIEYLDKYKNCFEKVYEDKDYKNSFFKYVESM